MRKLLMTLAVMLAAATAIQAQESYPRAEIFGGYSYFNSDQFTERESLNVPGFAVSIAGNLTKNFGLAAEVSGHYGKVTITGVRADPQFDADTYTFLFGPRLSRRGESVTLFGHFLVGAARTKVDTFDSETDFAWAVGGGIDFKASNLIAVRAFQFDYLPIRAEGETAHNFRASIGLVFRFGQPE